MHSALFVATAQTVWAPSRNETRKCGHSATRVASRTRSVVLAKANGDIGLEARGDSLIVRPLERLESTAGGLVLTKEAKAVDAETMGVVVAVGKGQRLHAPGEYENYGVKVGDTVVFDRFGAEDVKGADGRPYKVVRYRTIRAKW
mmetsp:Transcript_6430/g.17229  ORF Transcript_6430/g.17229 Transcript_6430/m.17229 type:complete len:145 (-) Transcript_6430:679-1113(-)